MSMDTGIEDVEAGFMEMFAEKRKIMAEAQAMYSTLCSNVEKANIEILGIKAKLFEMKGALKESEIRIEAYEKREMELRDEEEKKRIHFKEAEVQQKEAKAAKDALNRGFIKRVIELSDDYRCFKNSCERKTVSQDFQDLIEEDRQLDIEIKQVMGEMGINDGRTSVSLVLLDLENERILWNLCYLKKQLKYDIKCLGLSNTKLQGQISQLQVLKTALQKEIEQLREIMSK